jgi:uncharacterized protein DUF6511
MSGARDGRKRNLTNLMGVCVVCGRQGNEPCQWASLVWPTCGAECKATLAGAIASAVNGFLKTEIGELALLTFMETEAIKDARQSLYDALVKIGVEHAFDDCTAEEIDSVIKAVWDRLRASMHQQSARGEMPI